MRLPARPSRAGLAASLAATLFSVAGASPALGAKHRVALTWRPVFTDIAGARSPNVVDVFMARGRPFPDGPGGHAHRVVTRTPREQSSDPVRTPTFVIRTARGRVRGRLRVEKTYLETTATHQLASFEGTGSFEGGSGAYRGAHGPITRVWGRVDCFAGGDCAGELRLTGSLSW